MKLKIKVPPKESMEQLKLLLAVKFGLKAENDFVLVHKIERILHDLDFVYVNLIKALRDPEAAKLQKEAMARLSQRYELVARSISHAPKPKKEASQPKGNKPDHGEEQASNVYQLDEQEAKPKKKARPMSSKMKREPV